MWPLPVLPLPPIQPCMPLCIWLPDASPLPLSRVCWNVA